MVFCSKRNQNALGQSLGQSKGAKTERNVG
jgi:hypothetical protein